MPRIKSEPPLLTGYKFTPDMSSSNSNKTLPGVVRLTWGIFGIAYVPLRLSVLPQLSIGTISDVLSLTWYMSKLVSEVYLSSRLGTILFISCHVWLCTSPAISLYCAFRTLQILDGITAKAIPGRHDLYRLWVVGWFMSVCLTTFVHRKHNALTNCLAGHLRARLLPRLARASLRLDMRYARMSHYDSAFQTDSCNFGSVPEMDIFRSFFTRLGDITRVLLELFVATWIIHQTKDQAARLFATVGFCMVIFSMNSPTNWIGGAGYTFWTTHPAYHKLHALYSMIFEIRYRESVCKDGLSTRLEEEFIAASNQLGPQDIDAGRLASYVEPIPWYWELGQGMILESPMVIFAFISLWSFPTSALLSLALIQYATGMLKADVYRMRAGSTGSNLLEIMKKSKILYETIGVVDNERTLTAYPTSTSDAAGMKISLKHVSITYDGRHERKNINAVVDVSVDIEPGQLVLIVGQNGSGKSSLLKLLPMTMRPSSGDVYIDDKLTSEYDIGQIRNAMAILSQDERMFPISLHDNMLMGLTERAWRLRSQQSTEKLVEYASRLGDSWGIMRNVGLNTVLDPVRVVRQSTECVGNGKVDRAAYDELDRCATRVNPVKISGGERQRLLATRLITRAVDSDDIKLIVVDEPNSALDPIAERNLFNTFMQMRTGRTVIFVTHRFRQLADHADLILCMANGKIVERGTHAQLLNVNGEYARLFNAQVQESDK